MKKIVLCLGIAFLACITTRAQVTIDYFLPKDVTYNKDIPTPKQFTGYEVGEWHLTHDKLYNYMIELARVSERAIWEEYARSYENRPLGHLIISSPENIKKIEQLKEQHLMLCDPTKSDNINIKDIPVFILLGYGIHGNESSGQNASVLTAYYLTAGEGSKIDELLKNAVILIDPSLNPDGMQRHSTWVNSTRSLNNNPDPNSWEFNEPWPGGRTNHYWFDLNRDYLLPQHPETIGRLASFYQWRPNLISDHHEMSANSTFFFQPGIQSRNNPLTSAENQTLTAEIAKYHEKYLNEIGSLYFSEESYDDFYVGKGSAYPDIHGSVGILFEQAGVKGHLKETPGGLLSFPFAIRNQFTASLSTLEAGFKMKDKLLESQREFYKDALNMADKDAVKAYIFTESSDNGRTYEFIKNLVRHHIKVYKLLHDITKEGVQYKAGNSYVVPLQQNEYRFIRSLFEPVKEFTDSIFYDISTWVLPMSFNIQYTAIRSLKDFSAIPGEEIQNAPVPEGSLYALKDSYAYLFEWNEYYAPKALYMLQSAGIIARVATDTLVYNDGKLDKKFSYGTIMVPASGQKIDKNELYNLMDSVAVKCGIKIYGVSTGHTPQGIDMGSNSFIVLKKPSVAMFAGNGSNSSDAGEIWHMFDTRFNMPVTMITPDKAGTADFDRYNVMIITGSPDISASGIENIKTWNKKGGIIIAYGTANEWLSKNKLATIDFVPEAASDGKEGIYINKKSDLKAQEIPGTIFETQLDLSHPLCFGYTRNILPVIKSSNTAVKKDANIYNNPINYTSSPLLSGYCSKENIERIKETPFASIHGKGIISIYDNTNFRGSWYGTNKIFMNAVFFGQIVEK